MMTYFELILSGDSVDCMCLRDASDLKLPFHAWIHNQNDMFFIMI